MTATPIESDTIAAIATAPGAGGIGIVRISGPKVSEIARALLGTLPEARLAEFHPFKDAAGNLLDEGIALYYPAPHSFTGEEVLELQGHGGPVVLDLVLQAVLAQGARLAEAGEFSRRAFLNGRLDLAQAEAIADLIESGSQQAARAAVRSLHGEFSDRVHELVAALTALRVYVEAAIDFPEEEVDFLSDGRIQSQLESIDRQLKQLVANSQQGRLLREGIIVVLAGPPNAGKSSLMNALSRAEAAIVSEVPGTTRDVLREQVVLKGLPVQLIDTAGLRETADGIEGEGIRRARKAIAEADHILFLVDDADTAAMTGALPEGLPDVPVTLVRNKIDLTGRLPGPCEDDGEQAIAISAATGAGVDTLVDHIIEAVRFDAAHEGAFSARRRHLDALAEAGGYFDQARTQLLEYKAGELVAEELRLAQQALGRITGEVTSDDLLGEIFANFCIGK